MRVVIEMKPVPYTHSTTLAGRSDGWGFGIVLLVQIPQLPAIPATALFTLGPPD